MTPVALSDFTVVSAIGTGRTATLQSLRESRTGLQRRRFETAEIDSWLGVVDGLDDIELSPALAGYDCRNNRLAELALRSDGFEAKVRAAAARWGAHRIGVFLGTSTSGILSTEQAYRHRDPASGALPKGLNYAGTQNTYSVAGYVRAALRLDGPAFVISTACSSSAKTFAAAARMLQLGLIDAAVVGGVDSLCMTTLYGFRSLELLSADICRPWDQRRDGLSLGEGAAFALLERDAAAPAAWLIGAGESSDGHHMSSPLPDGAGAVLAMRAALKQAGVDAAAVDYLNLHGTGTPGNDAAEDTAVCEVFGRELPCSSTKGFTGHTLGAAGAVEAAITVLALQHGLAPRSLNAEQSDPALHANILRAPLQRTLAVVASNSFGFGGTNACLLFGASRER